MKKAILTAALLVTVGSSFAMSDELYSQKNPANVTGVAMGYELVAPMQETVVAVEDLGKVLERAHEVRQGLVKRQVAGERLTDRQDRFVKHDVNQDFLTVLDRNLTNRVEFFKRAHNWNGDNKYEHSGNYEVFLNKNNEKATETVNGYSNSYGWNVLRNVRQDALSNVKAVLDQQGEAVRGEDIAKAILAAASNNAATVNNEELRYYINELVWYTAKQTVKETNKELSHVLK